jgi:uncharacterized membrane protein
MGFGIALLGYGCFALYEIGGGILAAPLLAYGFFLASRLEKNFMRAAVSALFLLPRGIIQFLVVIGLFDIGDIPALNTATYIVHLGAWMLMSYFWLTAVINIARECNAPKLERTAQNRLVLTVVFITLSLAAGLLNMFSLLGGIAYTVTSIQFILQYVVIIANILFLHTCFVLITSEKQYEKDKQQLAKGQNEAIKKMEEKRAARQEKLNRRNGKK